MPSPFRLSGDVRIPGDKSITHRAVMFGAVAEGTSVVRTTVLGRDNFATARIMRQLGAEVAGEVSSSLIAIAKQEGFESFGESKDEWSTLRITGRGFSGLHAPDGTLDCGNSGTTARLLTGLLAGRPFESVLVGDASLSKRPFKRVVDPLSAMGARFEGDRLPLTIRGGDLHGIDYVSPHASAQVKSAILLAGLQTSDPVSVTEPRLSRDHTERMLTAMGCPIESICLGDGSWRISLPAQRGPLRAQEIVVPGDFSAAAFFLVAGSIFPGSDIRIVGVGLNDTRIGLFHILERMGASMKPESPRVVGGEKVVDLRVQAKQLHGIDVPADDVVLAIDEIPILAVAAAVASGTTRIRGAKELRVKESDRLAMSAQILRCFGGTVEEYEDGLDVIGNPNLIFSGRAADPALCDWKVSGDHRIAMCGAILQLLVSGTFELPDKHAVETSFPNFGECLQGIMVRG